MKAPTRRWFPVFAAGVALTVAAPVLLHKNIIQPAAAETSMAALQAAGVPSLAPLIEKVTPAVVNVSVKLKSQGELTKGNLDQIPKEFRRFFESPDGQGGDDDQPRRKAPGHSATGSGVIIDAKNGYIMTNFHVIDHADDITITLKDRREFTAKLIGGDEGTDVALLKIDADDLTSIPIGDSSTMKVGDFVVAVGNPFGLTQTVTSGIVSALGRSGLAIEGFEDFIQTDASINPGNSGGALVNMKGELIGINTAIIGPNGGSVGIGFAIPTNMAKAVETQLVQYGEVKRGHIGVQIQDMTPELAKSLGVEKQIAGAVIERVDHDSPAEHGGLKTGDVVVGIDGKSLNNASDLRNRVGLLPVGSTVHMTVLRGGTKKELELSIEKQQEAVKVAAVTDRPSLQGARFAGADGVPSKAAEGRGVEVTEVERGSPAWQVGLRAKDMIVAVNRSPVKNVQEMDAALKSQREAALFIKRAGEDVLIVV